MDILFVSYCVHSCEQDDWIRSNLQLDWKEKVCPVETLYWYAHCEEK